MLRDNGPYVTCARKIMSERSKEALAEYHHQSINQSKLHFYCASSTLRKNVQMRPLPCEVSPE